METSSILVSPSLRSNDCIFIVFSLAFDRANALSKVRLLSKRTNILVGREAVLNLFAKTKYTITITYGTDYNPICRELCHL